MMCVIKCRKYHNLAVPQKQKGMDKTEKIQSILKAVEQEVNQWVNEEENIRDPILYEQKLLEMAFNFGKTLMLSSQGKVPKDRNVKKKS